MLTASYDGTAKLFGEGWRVGQFGTRVNGFATIHADLDLAIVDAACNENSKGEQQDLLFHSTTLVPTFAGIALDAMFWWFCTSINFSPIRLFGCQVGGHLFVN